MTFSYTAKELFNSSAVNEAYYNEDTKDLVVVLKGGTAYQYRAVPSYVWSDFVTSWSAGAYYASHIKREYGPSTNLGFMNTEDSYFEEAKPEPVTHYNLAPDGTVTSTFNSVINGVETINIDWRPLRKHTVRFNSGISDREYVVETTDVESAVADLFRIAEMIGVEVTVKEVVTHFE